MAEKNNANIGFEKQIWDAACVLWGHIPAAEYRKVIIGLISFAIFPVHLKENITSLLQRAKVLKKIVTSIWARIFSSFRKSKMVYRCSCGSHSGNRHSS